MQEARLPKRRRNASLRWSLVIGALSLCAPRLAVGDEGLASYAQGKAFKIDILDERLIKTPQWKEAAANPPLSPRMAIKLADQTMSKLITNPESDQWYCVSATLCPARAVDRWFWKIRYEPEKPHHELTGIETHLILVVFMDGTVPAPTVKPYHP
jgi:hypothetical protein